MTWTIKPATAADLPALGRLGALLMRVHYGFDARRFLPPGDNPEEGYAWFLGSQLANPDAAVLVAVSAADVIGYVYAGVEPLSWRELRDRAGFVYDLVVDDRQRRGGVATALLDAAVEWLRAQGVPRVILWTADQNRAAQQLFSRQGFRPTMIEMTREL